jgi:hypothetical protein
VAAGWTSTPDAIAARTNGEPRPCRCIARRSQTSLELQDVDGALDVVSEAELVLVFADGCHGAQRRPLEGGENI